MAAGPPKPTWRRNEKAERNFTVPINVYGDNERPKPIKAVRTGVYIPTKGVIAHLTTLPDVVFLPYRMSLKDRKGRDDNFKIRPRVVI